MGDEEASHETPSLSTPSTSELVNDPVTKGLRKGPSVVGNPVIHSGFVQGADCGRTEDGVEGTLAGVGKTRSRLTGPDGLIAHDHLFTGRV